MMAELLTGEALAAFLTLAALEIVLGIDNLMFVQIVASRCRPELQDSARRWGLVFALLTRLALLFSIAWVAGLVRPIADLWGYELSWRDIILGGGGIFLLVKATMEIHHSVESGEHGGAARPHLSFLAAIIQIALLDIVFSLDSVITAVGMADHIAIMVAAVVAAMIVMLVAAAPVGRFVHNHPTVKMLCLSFLLLIGTALIAEALHFHIPKGYIYFAIAFSAGVEALNMMVRRKQARKADTGERVV
ncbi:TerC family protein [Dongia deserti]|uniref:TerC family protein n=1 Tax=Dongia deserti TaxID=2268030 RepID=UPI002AC33542|nr:TerC family protein [Dongia deserti]